MEKHEVLGEPSKKLIENMLRFKDKKIRRMFKIIEEEKISIFGFLHPI